MYFNEAPFYKSRKRSHNWMNIFSGFQLSWWDLHPSAFYFNILIKIYPWQYCNSNLSSGTKFDKLPVPEFGIRYFKITTGLLTIRQG